MAIPLETRTDSADTREVTRHDTYRLDKSTRQEDGSLRVDAIVTRPGVFTYGRSDGGAQREYRPPEEVYAADSIASLADKTITVLHPSDLVDPTNWKQVAVGHVSGLPTKNDPGVKAQLVISDAATIRDIESGKLKEISCGYRVATDRSSGVTPDGEKYDSIQRGIRYNHVAIGPGNWGRQGPEVSLRLDSEGNQITQQETQKMDITIHFDGQAYTVKQGSIEHSNLLAKISAKDAEIKAKLDAAAHSERTATEAKARADAAEAARAAIQVKLDAAPAVAFEAAKSRITLEGQVGPLLGADFKVDGKTDREIRVAALQKLDPEFKADGKDDVYIAAYFDAEMKRKGASRQDSMLGNIGTGGGSGTRNDANYFDDKGNIRIDEDSPDYFEAVQAKAKRIRADAHKRPLSVSK